MAADPVCDDEYLKMIVYVPEKIKKCIGLMADEYLKNTSIKSYYMPYIIHLAENDGATQKDLKEHIPFDKSRISIVINQLINQGLVYDDGVGRNSCLHLTKDGVAAFSVCKMFFNIVKRELFMMKDEDTDLFVKRTLMFNEHLDDVIEKYSRS